MEKNQVLKTKLFKEGAILDEEFKEDFAAFLEVTAEVAEGINKKFQSVETLFKDIRIITKELSDELDYSGAKISRVLSVISFFAKALEKKENIDNLLSDLLSEGYISKNELERAKEKTKLLSGVLKLWRNRREERRFEKAGAPEFYGCSYSSNLRLLTQERYDIKSVGKEYAPKVERFIPVGLIEMNLRTISGEESISFQVNIEELKDLIEILDSLKKELNLLNDISKKLI